MIFTNKTTTGPVNRTVLEEQYLETNPAQLLYILPTNRARNALRNSILSHPKFNPRSFPFIYSIDNLATELFGRVKAFKLISDAAAMAVLKRVIKEYPSVHFSNSRGEMPLGTMQQLRAMFVSMKRNGVDPEELYQRPVEEHLQQKHLDFCDLYKNYCKSFGENSLYEISDVYAALQQADREILKKEATSILGDTQLIIVQLFSELTVPEILFLNSLSNALNAQIIIEFDYNVYNKSLFGSIETIAGTMEQAGLIAVPEGFEKEPELNRILREHLFKVNNSIATDKHKFHILPGCTSREQEVFQIANYIAYLIKEKNVQPENIAIGFKLINEYSVYIRKVFPDFGIPFNLTDRFTLSDNIISGKIFALLRLIENGFFYQDLEAVYGYFGEMQLQSNASVMTEFAGLSKVLTGSSKWLEALQSKISSLSLSTSQRDASALRNFSLLYADIVKLHKILEPFTEYISATDFKNAILALLEFAGYPNIVFTGEYDQIMLNSQAYKNFVRVLNELCELTTKEHGNEKLPLRDQIAQLRTVLFEARYNYPAGFYSGVQITTFEELRGLSFEYIFFAGMYEGNFPARYTRDIIAFEDNSSAEKKYLLNQRYLFYMLLSKTNAQVIFSYPLKEAAKEFSESHFLFHLKRVCNIKTIGETGYLPLPGKNYSYSKAGLNAALQIKNNNKKGSTEETPSVFRIDSLRRSGESVYNGVINPENPNLSGIFESFAHNVYSFTAIDILIKCPFRFLAKEYLQLKQQETPDEEIGYSETGILLHKILRRFIDEIIREGTEDYSVVINDTQRVNRLFEIAQEELKGFEEYPPLSQFEIEKITGIDNNRNESLLNVFVENERKRFSEEKFTPKYTEFSFGFNKDELVTIGGLNIKGQADRIDLAEAGGKKYYTITDYKSGSVKWAPADYIKKGLLQLPIYALAISKVITSKKMGHEVLKLYYNRIRFNKDAGYDVFGNSKAEEFYKKFLAEYPDYQGGIEEYPDMLFNMTEYLIEEVKEEILSGKFTIVKELTTQSRECDYCNLYNVCRKHETLE